jgi:hypothetical protein
MARTLGQLKALVNVKTAQQTLTLGESDYLANLNASLDEMTSEVDPPETEKVATLQPLFRDVFDYICPSDVKGDAILEIRPLVELPGSQRDTSISRNSGIEFERNALWQKNEGKIAVEYDNGTKKLRILPNLPTHIENFTLHTCDQYDSDGTWTADTSGSDATNVQTDQSNYFEGSGSVSFDVDVSQSGNNYAVLYNPSISSKNISGLNQSSLYLFFYVYIPDSTYISSVSFVTGSDTSSTPSTKANYRTFTATTQFDGSAIQTGRNLFGIAYTGGSTTGTLDTTSLSYLEIKLSYSASQADMTGARLDGVFLREGEIHQARYYTTKLVSSASGTKQQYFTADDDYLLLNPEGEMLFVTKSAAYISPSVKDQVTGQTNAQSYMENKRVYTVRYPSKRKPMVKNWYYH